MKKEMKLQELQILAQKVQLKLKPEETSLILTNFLELEKLLVKFRQLKLGDNQPYQPQAKITLKNLYQLTKKFSIHTTKQGTIRHVDRGSAAADPSSAINAAGAL